jgi:hypothetical protein
MNTRLRLFIILLVTGLLAAVYTFPLWFPSVANLQDLPAFPELPADFQEAFDALPVERREDYLALREVDLTLAARMAASALQPALVVPDEEQANPQRSGQEEILSGSWTALTINRSVTGDVILYELPDGARYLWLEPFEAIPAPGLRLFLSTVNAELLDDLPEEEPEYRLTLDDLLLDPLRFDVGGQAYDIPREADLSRYNSVILYSTEFDRLWAYAVLQ